MKIIQIAPRYYPSLGGVEEVVKQYSERLVKDFGHAVKVYTSDLDTDSTFWVNGVQVNRLKTFPFFKNGPFSPITLSLPIKLLNEKADIWHLHANKRFTTDTAALVNTIKRTPFVFSPHAGMFGRSFLGKLHNKTIGKLAFRANVVLVDSIFEKNLLEKSGMKVKRFEHLPIGIDTYEFAKADLSIKEKFQLKNKKIILFVGRLTSHKGLDTLIKAMPEILSKEKDAFLLAIGPDFGEKMNMQKLIDNNELKDNVTLTGSLSRAEILGAYKNADVFCLPSRSEAFGIVMIEAMAAGVPVLAANNTAMPEIIRDGENGLIFDTENPRDLADKIIQLLNNQKLTTSLVNNASNDIAEIYNWDKIVTRLDNIYKDILR